MGPHLRILLRCLAGLRACGLALNSLLIVTLISYSCIGIPAAWGLSQYTTLGVYGLWLGYGAGLYAVGAVLVYRVLRPSKLAVRA